jgi:hypothetical protein
VSFFWQVIQRADSTVVLVPKVIVEAPSIWPGILVGVLTLGVLIGQLIVFWRQAEIMRRQAEILESQASNAANQAVTTFYQIAFDITMEFRKANVLPTVMIPVDPSNRPQHVLREAGRLFAPLGNDFLRHITHAGIHLDIYFLAVGDYNKDPTGHQNAGVWQRVQLAREWVGNDLDLVSTRLAPALQWQDPEGKAYNFREMCSLPPDFLGEVDTETGTPE